MLKRWVKISEEILGTNPWWTHKRDRFRLPSGSEGLYDYVETFGCSMVIPLLPDGTILMVKQHRYLAGRESLEFPCGGIGEGRTPEETALRELQEETGHTAEELELLGKFVPQSGLTKSECSLYLASKLKESSLGTPDETEEFERVVLSPQELEDRIGRGELWDGLTLASWALASRRLLEGPMPATPDHSPPA